MNCQMKGVCLGILTLLISNVSSAAIETKWKIPVRCLLREFTLTGAEIRKLVSPIKEKSLPSREWVDVQFRSNWVPSNAFDETVYLRGDKDSQYVPVYFSSVWQVFSEKEPMKLKLYSNTDSALQLRKSDEDPLLYEIDTNGDALIFTLRPNPGEDRSNIFHGLMKIPFVSHPQFDNPMRLVETKAPAFGWGSHGIIHYEIQQNIVAGQDWRFAVIFIDQSGVALQVRAINIKEKSEIYKGTTQLPPEKLINSAGALSPKSKRVHVMAIGSSNRQASIVALNDVIVCKPAWSIIFGCIAIIVFSIIILFMPPSGKKRWQNLTFLMVSPLNRYSISLVQITFWTVIIIFAFGYVGFSRREFLQITPQILVLLGISAGTTILSNAANRVPPVPKPILDQLGQPVLSDLIMTGGKPDIFKVQIFAFTVLVGWQVLREVIQVGNFPVLDANILALMGVSGGVYVTNQWSTSKPAWEEVNGLLRKVEEEEKAAVGLPGQPAEAAQESPSVSKKQLIAKLREIRDQS